MRIEVTGATSFSRGGKMMQGTGSKPGAEKTTPIMVEEGQMKSFVV
jgi:hypothetical protein